MYMYILIVIFLHEVKYHHCFYFLFLSIFTICISFPAVRLFSPRALSGLGPERKDGLRRIETKKTFISYRRILQ